jgi:putative ABC transport system permease protein
MNYAYIFKELRHHHHRTLVNVLGIGIGVALFVSINAISAGYQKAVSQPFKNIGADLVVQRAEKRGSEGQAPASMKGIRLPFSNQWLSQGVVEKLGAIEGVDAMAASLLLWDFDKGGFKTIMGVDLNRSDLGPVKVKEWLVKGRFPQNPAEAVLEKHFAKFRQIQPGDTIAIADRSFAVVGLIEIKEGSQVASANIYLSLADAQSLFDGQPGAVNVVYLRLKSPSLLNQVKGQIPGVVPGASSTSSDSLVELMGGISRISDQFSLMASLVALGGAVFLIIKTMLANLIERSREIGILKAVGWTQKDVQRQLMGEVLLQSLLGGVLGILLGYLISYLLGLLQITTITPWELNPLPAFARDTEAATQAVRLPVSVSFRLASLSLGLSLMSGALASWLMGRRTAAMKPAEILRKL